VVGYEALVRWQHPGRGLLPPMRFISTAEDTGLIVQIGRWVLETACRTASQWQPRADGERLRLSVNLSARQLFDPGLVVAVHTVLADTGFAAEHLTLEITESVLMEDTTLAVTRLNALKHLGVRIAIDDFGTGYSSLSYLRSFPVDVLKIDKSFTDSVADDVEGACFVQAILHLAQVLRVTTVAEGIEAAAQAERLRQLGCDQAQGFYFGHPVPEPDAGRIAYSSSDAGEPILERS